MERPTIAPEVFDEFAIALSASIHGNITEIRRVILDPDVCLSQILLASLTANIALMSFEADDLDMSVAEYLPGFLSGLRDEVVQ